MKKFFPPPLKFVIAIFIIVPISMIFALIIAEKMVRYASPQLTYSQAKLVSLRAYAKSDLLPFALAPNIETVHIGNTHEFSYTIKTNSLGYRMDEFPVNKPSDEYRILMLGDSLTFGFGVEQHESFVAKLEEKLNRYLEASQVKNKRIRIINAGFVDSKSPDSYYLYLKEQGLKLNPDLIFVNYFVKNDVLDLDDTIWEKIDENGLPQKISSRTSYIDPPFYRLKKEYQNWKFAIPILRDSHLWILFTTTWETKSPEIVTKIKKYLNNKELPLIQSSENDDCLFKEKCSLKMKELSDKFFSVAKATIDLGQKNNIPIVVSLLPANPQVKEWAQIVDAQKRYPKLTIEQITQMVSRAEPQKSWTEFFTKLNVPMVNPLPYVADIGYETFYFPQDGHPTINGNEAFAVAFFDFLEKEWNILSKI